MNKNCEVIEMIGSSQNTNLLGVGESVFYYAGTGSFSVIASKAASLTFTILTPGVTFTNAAASGQTVQTIAIAGSSGERIIGVSGACKILITNDKYILQSFRDTSGYLKIDLSQLEYAVELEALLLRGMYSNALSTGNISSLKNCTKLKRLTLLSPNINGSLSDLPDAPIQTLALGSLSDINEHANIEGDISILTSKTSNPTLIRLSNSLVSGNISSLSTLKSLTEISVNNTEVNGSLNSFLDAMYNSGNGRTSGTLTINAQGSGVLYNGNPITTALTATFSSSGWSIA